MRWLMIVAIFWASSALTGFASWAAELQAIHLEASPRLELASRAQVFVDAQARLDAQAVRHLAPQSWEPFDEEVSLGFTDAVVWIRFSLERRSTRDPIEWYLTLTQPLIEDVRLYEVDASGNLLERPGTTRSGRPPREFSLRQPVFELLQPELGIQQYWLRLSTPTSMSTRLELHRADSLFPAMARDNFAWGLMYGAYAFVLVFYALFYFWTRERLHGYYTAYILVNLLAALFTSGWPLQLIPGLLQTTHIKLLGIWIALSLTTGALLSMEMLALRARTPRLFRTVGVFSVGITIIGIALIAFGAYRQVVPVLQLVSILMIALFCSMAVSGAIWRHPGSLVFLIAFMPFYAGVVWRYLRNSAMVEPSFWSDNSYQLGAFIHIMAMSVVIFTGYNRLMREKKAAESRLELETRLRQEQRDFVDMVSHEFRTPLAVVAAATENLMGVHTDDPATLARLAKIERAQKRMSDLMTTYLEAERVAIDTRTPGLHLHAVEGVCTKAVEWLPDEFRDRVRSSIPTALMWRCDADLLAIAIGNLLHNGCKHSAADQSVELKVFAQSGRLMIEVIDGGDGVPAEEAPQIFNRYYRGRTGMRHSGMGLGLHIVQTVARVHGGQVTVRAALPKGSAFVLELAP